MRTSGIRFAAQLDITEEEARIIRRALRLLKDANDPDDSPKADALETQIKDLITELKGPAPGPIP